MREPLFESLPSWSAIATRTSSSLSMSSGKLSYRFSEYRKEKEIIHRLYAARPKKKLELQSRRIITDFLQILRCSDAYCRLVAVQLIEELIDVTHLLCIFQIGASKPLLPSVSVIIFWIISISYNSDLRKTVWFFNSQNSFLCWKVFQCVYSGCDWNSYSAWLDSSVFGGRSTSLGFLGQVFMLLLCVVISCFLGSSVSLCD